MTENQTMKERGLIFESAADGLPETIPCPKCKGGMKSAQPPMKWGCDGCSRVCEQVEPSYGCRTCNQDYCHGCGRRMLPKTTGSSIPTPPEMPTGEGAPTVCVIQGKRRVNWRRLREMLPWDRSSNSVQNRKNLFGQVDVNGNGILSLAEVDKGLRDIMRIDEIFNCKPVIIRAFNAVKAVHQGVPPPGNLGERSRALTVDPADYVEKCEFRLLLAYLYGYFELWEIFELIDENGDRRISHAEFEHAGVPLLKKLGVNTSNPEHLWQQLDNSEHKGMVLFKEFSDWALRVHLNDRIGHDGEYE